MSNTKPTMPKTIDGIPLLVDHPDYRDELQKLHAMQAREAEFDALIRQSEGELRAARQETIKTKAESVLRGSAIATLDVGLLERDHSQLEGRRQIYVEAVRMQRERLAQLERSISRKVCEAAKPAHVEAVRKLAAALVEVGRATAAEQEVRCRLEGKGYRVEGSLWAATLPDYGVMGLGTLDNFDGNLNGWLRGAVEQGYLAADDQLVRVGNTLRGNETAMQERRAAEEAARLCEQSYMAGTMPRKEAAEYRAEIDAAEAKRQREAEQAAQREHEERQRQRKSWLGRQVEAAAVAVGL